MRALRRRGHPIEAIAAAAGVSKSAVHRAVADLGVDARAAANRARAEAPPPWLREARRLHRRGLSRLAIARALGVPKSTLYRALDKFSS
jgi:DNA-binding IclR family transcriptional regulator